ncbi:hypothetical protein B0H15DRAFT_944861 [Mycena belliarum]|uniref:SET domain-containing protein n=1 Tax=Mycena belliarum TaxID=1033014 RepID=A0AAD6UK31_9AGAR|nr:hypothetical protein B0H15DRAFT_944861 [Mycena belliae]
MAFGMKRGFLSKAQGNRKSASAERDIANEAPNTSTAVQLKSLDSAVKLDAAFQFSNVCRLYSENPCIFVADDRLPGDAHYLFLPPKNAHIVFVDSLESVQTISKWALWDEPPPSPLPDPPFLIQDCGAMGVGMCARRPIARGELIMLERPVYVSNPNVRIHIDQKAAFYTGALAGLSPTTQAAIAALRNAHPVSDDVSHLRGILLTNALAAKVPHTATPYPALFPYLCRANHACTPNAHYTFDATTCTGYLHALRAVAAGEEITIGYTDLAAPRAQRRAELRTRYAFECTCAACGLPEARGAASDARRAAIGAYLTRMKTGGKVPPGAHRAAVEVLVRAAEEEGLVECASILALSALRIAQRDGDTTSELRLLVDAMDYVRALEGNESAGFLALAERLGLTPPELAAIYDSGTPGSFDYAFFGQLMANHKRR